MFMSSSKNNTSNILNLFGFLMIFVLAFSLVFSVAFLPTVGFADEVPTLPEECGTIDNYNIVEIASGSYEFTSGNDFVSIGDSNVLDIDGLQGNDCILVGNNNSGHIFGNNGADIIIMGTGNQGKVEGGNGADTMIIGDNNSGEINGEDENGSDTINIGDNNSGPIFGGNGSDNIRVGENNSGDISGDKGGDTIIYGYGNTGEIDGGSGENTIIAVPPAPSASPLPNTYTSLQSVALSSDGADSIYYTTDGTTPDCSTGTQYESTISIFSTKTITTVGCMEGYASPVASLAYTVEKLEVDPDDLSSLLDAGVFAPKDGSEATATTEILVAQDIEIKISSSSDSKVVLSEGLKITRVGGGEFDANQLTSSEVEADTLVGLGSGSVIEGALQWGIASTSLEFSKPITISIFVGTDLNGTTLNVVRSITGTDGWTSDGIEGSATCLVEDGLCTFEATKASFYAVTSTSENKPQDGGLAGGGVPCHCIPEIEAQIVEQIQPPKGEPSLSGDELVLEETELIEAEEEVVEEQIQEQEEIILEPEVSPTTIVKIAVKPTPVATPVVKVVQAEPQSEPEVSKVETASVVESTQTTGSKSFIVSLFSSIGRLILHSLSFFE